MQTHFFLFSIFLFQNSISYKVASNQGRIQEIPPPSILPKIEEIKKKSFKIDKFCGGYDSFGLCSICYDSYLDIEKKKCSPVEKLIQNCLSYDQDQQCLVCEFGFRIWGQGESCMRNQDPNCLVENSKECEVNLFFSIVFFQLF